LRLTRQQNDVLIGTLLGDGCLELNGSKVRLRIDHSEKQKEYVEWKHHVLANFAAGKPRSIKVLDKRTKRIYQHSRFDTLSKGLFVNYMRIFYKNGKKIVPQNVNRLLKNRLALAVWFMDDGYNRNDCKGMRINTQSYSLAEQKRLQDCMRKNFNLRVNIHRQSGKFNLYVPSADSKKFCDLIADFVLPSMKYKLL